MKIGIKKNMNSDIIKYYELNYDLVRTSDFDEKSRLLKPDNGVSVIGYSKNKTCRFCGKSEDEVSFKKMHMFFQSQLETKFYYQIMSVIFVISILETQLKMIIVNFLAFITA